VTIGADTSAEEDNKVAGFGMRGENLILKYPLKFAHDAGTLVKLCAEVDDTTLFVLPLDQLEDPANKTATAAFADAYCAARNIGYKEDYTLLFNTAVVKGLADYHGIGATYLTRESFEDADGANKHLKNVSAVFARALGVSKPTGFALLGSAANLDKMADTIKKFKADAYVLDPRSFRQKDQNRLRDYFSVDIFLQLNSPADLASFEKTWGEVRNLAANEPGVLDFGMGVQHSADRKTVTAYFKECYKDADTYLAWETKAAPFVKTLLGISSIVTKPNPIAMTSHADQLAKVEAKCQALGCVQYTIDDCNTAEVVV